MKNPLHLLIGVLCLTGCASLPPRSGCAAGDVRYNFLTKTPSVDGVTENCWGNRCPAFAARTSYYENGQVKEAACEPVTIP